MWQEIIVYLIGVLALAYAGWKIYRLFRRSKQTNNPCAGCSGCAFAEEARKRK
ncbi:FeoB-associated Cys-rich membrane protein [Parabacteroides sp. OttesenSCG-928-J18]|nr:FeoB-associated Cys-rich membrane protein [Parabacteroides sp. OttesenSCG-928-J18]